MKLSAETPPDGDFVRYLAALERESPSYQTLKSSVLDANIGAVPKPPPWAERLQRLQQTRPPEKRQPPAQNPSVRGLVMPLLQRLEEALAAAARKKRN